ncbi:ATP-binding protein [Chitinibacter sp. ZOR0017]|uniref:HAMP domain-containing sensor histidine kinase n=1 Tax=Chitinibacter sp. ZOR0017 TaxID=1339254 RepID=UPI00064658DE|nr:ATP-binding protein [Chitinibacter sp. ZOR0017]
MGRLFWKFFGFLFLAQLITIFAVGITFWLRAPADWRHPPPPPPAAHNGSDHPQPPPPPARPPHRVPLEAMIGGVLTSLLSAALLARYVAKPIRALREAFANAAAGELNLRISAPLARRNDELADLARDYDQMAEQLQALLSGQRRLLHDVSHELRSPLARLQLAIGLAQQNPARQADALPRIEREAQRMNQLLGELLTLSRLEARVSEPRQWLDWQQLLSELIEDARFEAQAKAQIIEWHSSGAAGVWGDPELLRRAAENILRNAIRYSPPESVIQVTLQATTDGHQLSISDQGPGVTPTQLAQIFAPFYRAEVGQTSGFGLGLAIAERVVTAHGGQIWAENAAITGLIVHIRLPAAATTSELDT